MKKAIVKVRDEGINFACYATVLVNGKSIGVTRNFPFGFRSVAFQAGEELARKFGYEVENPSNENQ